MVNLVIVPLESKLPNEPVKNVGEMTYNYTMNQSSPAIANICPIIGMNLYP